MVVMEAALAGEGFKLQGKNRPAYAKRALKFPISLFLAHPCPNIS